MNTPSQSSPDLPALDVLTGGAISAATAGERLTRVRQWLDTEPSIDLLQQVFKELSARDKGAAKPVKEKMEDMRRSKIQTALAEEWAAKANALLNHPKLNLADAMAWSRDAAKAGAPLSREPLSGLRLALADLVKHIEDLAHRAQVLRESALLMAQRIEVLSTKPWTEAIELRATLQSDLQRFDAEWHTLSQDRHWQSVDPKYPAILNEGAQHIHLVWDAFNAALLQTEAAAADATLPLPGVPAWADQLRVLRGEAAKPASATASKPVPPSASKPAPDPAQQAQAVQAVQQLMQTLEGELALGHSKATTAAATALRQSLKSNGRWLPAELEANAQLALTKATELEGWQRWRADQLRAELVTKAEALLKPEVNTAPQTSAPAEASDAAEASAPAESSEAAEASAAADASPPVEASAPAAQVWVPVLTGRKLQDTLRQLRDAWKQTDQGGQPNHALWKRFDQACNRAYPFVQGWLEKTKAESQAHREQRLALLAEVAAWTEAHVGNTDWKSQARELHQFSERWRNSGHLSEKTFAELQVQWKAAMSSAHAALEQAQAASIAKRRAMIEEAKQLASAAVLKIDAVKALQQRWQIESQAVALERKLAQKLWDAFRQPLDEAFQRKTQDRGSQTQALSAQDQMVLEASHALEKAIAQGDVSAIRQAMQHLNQVVTAQPGSAAANPVPPEPTVQAEAPLSSEVSLPSEAPVSSEATVSDGQVAEEQSTISEISEPIKAEAKPPMPAKKVVAVRGDDRPGQKKTEPVVAGRFGDKPGARRNERDAPSRRSDRDAPRSRESFAERGPRLGDTAFRAQRHAVELAEAALKKLAMQAHGEVLVHVLSAWKLRQAEQLPAAKELGQRITAAQRQEWVQAIATDAKGESSTALLRLEMAAEVNTPADHQADRRALQLQLLTKRHEAPPAQTWAHDVATVLQAAFTSDTEQRLQNVLRVLLRR